MPKNWIDWENTPMIEPEHPYSKPLGKPLGPTLKKGEVPRHPSNEEIAKIILDGAPKQPSNQQLFGHLVPTEEQIVKAEKEWDNRFNDFFDLLKKPVERQDLNKSWGCRGPIHKEKLTEEEKRISAIPVNAGLFEGD